MKRRTENSKRLRSHPQPSQPLAPLVEKIMEAADNVLVNVWESCNGCDWADLKHRLK
jgi:hypothetical protein